LILSPTRASGKPNMPIRLRPLKGEGLQILYRIKSIGLKPSDLSKSLSVYPSSISNVIHGKRRSARIESEIAKILNKKSWNDVVLEARSEVQGKPVEVILQEIEQQMHNARKASAERIAQYITQNSERAERVIRNGLADKKKRRGA